MLICHYRGYLGQVSIGNLLPLFVFSTVRCMLIKRSPHANFILPPWIMVGTTYASGREKWRCDNKSQATALYGHLKAEIRETIYFPAKI